MLKKLDFILSLIALSLGLSAFANDKSKIDSTEVQRITDVEIIEDKLIVTIKVDKPTYKPVLGFGLGTFGFIGDVKNTDQSKFTIQGGYRFYTSTYIDSKHLWKAGFTFSNGKVSGYQSSFDNLVDNVNFTTDIQTFAVNIEYGFHHIIPYPSPKRIRPFASIGLELLKFNSSSDTKFRATQADVDIIQNTNIGDLINYHYWQDGTIRNLPETDQNLLLARQVSKDYVADVNLAKDVDYGYNKDYKQAVLAIPLDLGFDIYIAKRVQLRTGVSFHFTFSDYIDHVAPGNNQGITANGMADIVTFSYMSLTFDLFSKTESYKKVLDLVTAENYDIDMMDDEDADGVSDFDDECPGTPEGVSVDTIGCPPDKDLDGIADYLDEEPNSAKGAFVNEQGITMTDDEILARIYDSTAVSRNAAKENSFQFSAEKYEEYYGKSVEVPLRFKQFDYNDDGYLSFDEVLIAIDKYFNFRTFLSSEDIAELNDFFFTQ